MSDNEIKELAETHWHDYVEPLLRIHGEKDDVIAKCRFHYITSAVHFAKHEREG